MDANRRRITTDKRRCYASPELPSATSFIRKTLAEMPLELKERKS
jgi:hypothetical protein